ncbi:MAG: hypothetical protein L6R40_000526 [Gallowayella cf. fulva]|nr:MAG: hypothetical protein L6R40_000526 [Xanthomendoza cf. fulva]
MQLTMKSSLALVAASLLTSVNAHSWVEDIHVIAPNGTFVGEPGYPRAFAKRAPGVDPDKAMVHLLPPNGRSTGNKILDSDPICMQPQQQPKQSEGSPTINAAAGDMVALRYQENGHVTLPQNQPGKAPNRGTVYIYGTSDPKPDDKFLSIHKVWNTDGTGGDKRGKLLATEPYDDGQCYQMNGGQISAQRQAQFKHKADPIMGQDLWCQNNFKIPQDAPSGKPYTVYWVWDWDTAPGTAGQPQGTVEKYTTCMDISISQGQGASRSKAADAGAAKFADGQDINRAAIPKYVQKLNAGGDIFEPGSVPSGQGAPAASSKPAGAAAPASAMPQSSAPAVASQKTVTVTASAPISEKTVTVTANAQPAIITPPTIMVTTHSTVYTVVSMSSAASPMTVSGVAIPTTSMSNRFTGTASAVNSAPTAFPATSASAGSSDSGYGKRSAGSAHAAAHLKGRSTANTKLRNPGSAKFRAI